VPTDRTARRASRSLTATALALAIACVALAVLSACGAAAVDGATSGPATNATVARVVDGDTIHVDRNGHEDTIRLIGMDTPETKKPNTAVECFGHEASAHLTELLPVGTRVRLERDAEERDRYDRILAYVYREDGMFVNLAMVADGYAGQLTVPPNVAHADDLTEAARVARTQGKGLWSACGGNHVAAG
jgi:micrococcal nuclease